MSGPLSWLSKQAFQTFKDMILLTAQDFINDAFKLIVDTVVNIKDIDAYFAVTKYLPYVQYIAATLLVVKVAWEVFKQQSGGMFDTEERSLGQYTLRVIWAGGLIYFLPFSITKILMPINDIVIKIIEFVGVEFKPDVFNSIFSLFNDLKEVGILLAFGLLTLGIGFLILGVIAGIRYIELLIAYLIAPLSAVSFVSSDEAVSVWVREAISIVFTQALQVFELQVLIGILTNVDNLLLKVVFCIGVLVVMFKGPQTLRKYVYATGTGSASVQAVGSGGRMAAMKFLMKSVK